MRYVAIAGLALLSTSVLADSVVEELSARSRIPIAELEQLLSNCDATQLSMNICAFRDFVETDMKLKETLSGLRGRCAERARSEQSSWKQETDAACNKLADDEAEGGSMRPMVFSSCRAEATAERIKALAARCGAPQQPTGTPEAARR